MKIKTGNKIIIIDSSEIIQEGLSQILEQNFSNFDIVKYATLDQVDDVSEKNEIRLTIINSSIIDNLSDPKDIYEKLGNTKILGIITSHYHRKLTTVCEDLIYISDNRETIINLIKNHLSGPAKNKLKNKLTTRENDVLKLLVRGLSNKQIAGELFISIHTVISHRKNISTKLGIKSTAGLAIYGIINNIIDVDDYLDMS